MSKDIKKAIDLLEAKKNKLPSYDDLKAYAGEVERSTAMLKRLMPDQAEAIDAVVASWEALLAQAKAGRKLKKVVKTTPDMTQSLLSGDPLGENSIVDQIVQGLNKQLPLISFIDDYDDDGEPTFHKFKKYESSELEHFLDSESIASVLNDKIQIDVSPDDLDLFAISRETNDRSELGYLDGAILPDGSVLINTSSSDRVTDHTSYFKNARAAVRGLVEIWAL